MLFQSLCFGILLTYIIFAINDDAWSDRVGPAACARNGYVAYVDGWFSSSCATYNADGTVQSSKDLRALLREEK